MVRRCRIVIADNQGILRDGLCALLAAVNGLEIAGTASSGADAEQVIDAVKPDLLIVDPSCSATFDTEMITGLKKRRPDLRILVLTFRKDDQQVEAALRAGADGYLLKNDGRVELYSAIDMVNYGQRYLSPAIRERVAGGFVNPQASANARGTRARALTHRELEVIKLIAEGQRTRDIARQLSLSHKTIEKHRTNLMRKLGLRTATAVAAYAIANGYHNP